MNEHGAILLTITSLLFSCTNASQEKHIDHIPNPSNQVVLSSEIKWEKLNPARGDQSPQAGTIWGDRNGTEATGFLAKFVDGFSSPPHIHNVTYRAMVIKGLIHNDDPAAEKMWMPAGSFWTQPAGESHITAAKGEENIAYVEIDQGPYLVKPIEEAFDNGERPVNIDKSNIVWLDASTTMFIDVPESGESPAIAFLWEKNQMSGKLLKLPAGFDGHIMSEGDAFHAVIIEGQSEYLMPNSQEKKILDPGSYVTSTTKAIHSINANQGTETMIYIRTNGEITVRSKLP